MLDEIEKYEKKHDALEIRELLSQMLLQSFMKEHWLRQVEMLAILLLLLLFVIVDALPVSSKDEQKTDRGSIAKFLKQADLAERVWREHLASFGDRRDVEYANTSTKLAMLYCDQGKYSEAKLILKEVLKIRENSLGISHFDTMRTLNLIGDVCINLDDYAEAETSYSQVLALEKVDSAKCKNELAHAYSGLGRCFLEKNSFKDSRNYFEKTLKIKKEIYGTKNPHFALVLNDLALLNSKEENFETAEALYKESISIFENCLGLDHVDTAKALGNLAQFYINRGSYLEAQELLIKVVEIYSRSVGESQPATVNAKNVLSKVRLEIERQAEEEK